MDLNTALDTALVTGPVGQPTVSGAALMMLAGPSAGVAALDAVDEVLELAHRAGRSATNLWAYENK